MTTIASSTTNPVEMASAHERKVVDAVPAEVHHPERAVTSETGTGDAWE